MERGDFAEFVLGAVL